MNLFLFLMNLLVWKLWMVLIWSSWPLESELVLQKLLLHLGDDFLHDVQLVAHHLLRRLLLAAERLDQRRVEPLLGALLLPSVN